MTLSHQVLDNVLKSHTIAVKQISSSLLVTGWIKQHMCCDLLEICEILSHYHLLYRGLFSLAEFNNSSEKKKIWQQVSCFVQ